MKKFDIKKDRTKIDDILIDATNMQGLTDRHVSHTADVIGKQQVSDSTPTTDTASQELNMCSLTVIYHEDFEDEIIGILGREMAVTRYTKVENVVGARKDTVSAEEVSIGKNHMLIIVGIREDINSIAAALRMLREIKGHGIRGFITPVDDLV